MKKFITGLLIITMAFSMIIMGAQADTVSTTDVKTASTLSVNGVGEITVAPDIAYISIGVQTKNEDASLAQNENKELMDKIVNALKDKDIEAKDLQTNNYSIYRSYDYSRQVKDDEEQVQVFFVNNTLSVTIRNIDNVGLVIDAAANAGANNFNSINFGTTKSEELYLEALKLAMESAKGKADTIAGTFGVKLTTPSKVNESGYNQGAVSRGAESLMYAADSKMSTAIEAGSLTITANVQVEYNY